MENFKNDELEEMLAVFSGFSSPIKVSISDKLEEEIERRKELSDLDFEDCDVCKLWGRAQIAMLKNLLLILAYKKKHCGMCGLYQDWKLKDGQAPTIGNNRQKTKVIIKWVQQ